MELKLLPLKVRPVEKETGSDPPAVINSTCNHVVILHWSQKSSSLDLNMGPRYNLEELGIKFVKAAVLQRDSWTSNKGIWMMKNVIYQA